MRPWIHLRLGAPIIVLGLLLGAVACQRGPASPHVSLDHTLEALRARFNADVDRTRVLMIVAPT
jgi:hypothetical protein